MFERNGHRGPLAAMGEKIRERLPVGIKNALPLIGQARTKAGRATLAQQTRETGFKVADDTMRAVSAGMGIADVRAMFRGDPPIERPNPRYKVFTNAFFAHIRPRYYERSSTKFTHTFGLGFLSAFTFIVETITGLILMVFYIPAQNDAYQSMVKILAEVPFGQLMRDIHRVGAELMVLFVGLHMLRVYLTGSFKHPRQFTWVTGVILLVLTLALSYSGYLLPWDQLAYWAVTIGTSMAKSAPPKEIAGYISNLLLRGGDTIGQNGLLRFYLGHVILLPILAIIFISVHYYRISRLHGISLPASEEESPDPAVRKVAKEKLDYLPDVLTKELMWIAIGVFAITAFSAFAFHAPLEHHSDPFRTPLHTTAPWYFLWIQGMLKDPFLLPILRAIDSTFGIEIVKNFYDSPAVQGVILPTIFALIALGIPYIDEFWDKLWGRSSSRLGRNRKLGITMGLGFTGLLLLFTYFGTPLYAVTAPPAVEIGQSFIPEECVLPPVPLIPEDCGEVRRLGYAGIPVGTYDLAQYATPPAGAGAFQAMLARMESHVNEQSDRAKQSGGKQGLTDAKGFFVVEDWQTDLKKVTLRITWTPQVAGDTGSYEKVIYLNRASVYQ
ncbi:MAG: cytochrome b N-terminal domain-containing protein [Chloroflexota bacterium]|nr:cytochrome b N-terminal domain-containing protein [Chloroflexota bacterium]